MTRRLIIFMLSFLLGFTFQQQAINALPDQSAWSQASFLTGENTFGYPKKVPDYVGFELSAAPGDGDARGLLEWDEYDALRSKAVAHEPGLPVDPSNSLFPPYAKHYCCTVSRDIHKPPPEFLS